MTSDRINRIDRVMRSLAAENRKVLAPFVTIGYPDVETSEALVETILDSGAHMLELGIPFSDPLSDGPTVQATSFAALRNGVTVAGALDSVRRLRARGVDAPLIFMGYYNPYLSYGLERFVADSASAGVDGLIVPDLPAEESGRSGRRSARSTASTSFRYSRLPAPTSASPALARPRAGLYTA